MRDINMSNSNIGFFQKYYGGYITEPIDVEKFKKELFLECGVEENPKKDLVYHKAEEYADQDDGSGLYLQKVHFHFCTLVNLIL